MCEKSFSKIYPDVKKETIWALWSKDKNWLKWHSGLISCKTEGAFKAGNHIILNQEHVGIVNLLISEMEPKKKFTAQTNFFGAEIFYTRSMEEKPDGLEITYSLNITGILKHFWYFMMKNKLVDCMEHDVDKLVEVARNLS